MRYIQGQDRTQPHLFPVSLDDSIDKNNEVRLIDLFVDTLVLNKFGFKVDFVENGRPVNFLENGIYMVHVKSANTWFVGRFVKE